MSKKTLGEKKKLAETNMVQDLNKLSFMAIIKRFSGHQKRKLSASVKKKISAD